MTNGKYVYVFNDLCNELYFMATYYGQRAENCFNRIVRTKGTRARICRASYLNIVNVCLLTVRGRLDVENEEFSSS